jgi:predicted nucleotidyltransferase
MPRRALEKGRIFKVLLYGSYARSDWGHDPVGRYFSGFDLLVVAAHEDLATASSGSTRPTETMPGEGEIREVGERVQFDVTVRGREPEVTAIRPE